jgi:serine/threonine protein kinase
VVLALPADWSAQFKRKLGKGATAVVYEAKNKKTGQKVAIKKIKKARIYTLGLLPPNIFRRLSLDGGPRPVRA